MNKIILIILTLSFSLAKAAPLSDFKMVIAPSIWMTDENGDLDILLEIENIQITLNNGKGVWEKDYPFHDSTTKYRITVEWNEIRNEYTVDGTMIFYSSEDPSLTIKHGFLQIIDKYDGLNFVLADSDKMKIGPNEYYPSIAVDRWTGGESRTFDKILSLKKLTNLTTHSKRVSGDL